MIICDLERERERAGLCLLQPVGKGTLLLPDWRNIFCMNQVTTSSVLSGLVRDGIWLSRYL